MEVQLVAPPLLASLVVWEAPGDWLSDMERDTVFFINGSATTVHSATIGWLQQIILLAAYP